MSTDFENAASNQLPPPPAEIPYIPTPEDLAKNGSGQEEYDEHRL